MLHRFPATYHEPYFKGYLRDDIAALLRDVGFEVESSEPYLVSKVVVARRPNRAVRRGRGVGGEPEGDEHGSMSTTRGDRDRDDHAGHQRPRRGSIQ